MSAPFLLRVRATPGSRRASVGGRWDGPQGESRLIVKVGAPPEKGKANKAVIEAVAKAFGLPNSAVRVTAGVTDRLKTLALDGDPESLAARLAQMLKDQS